MGRLKVGDSFGELALLKNEPRSATVTCREVWIFAVLEREDYKTILGGKQQEAMDSKAKDLRSVGIFNAWE